jgi:hypothetical protein
MRIMDSDSEDGRGEWLEDEEVLHFIERSEAANAVGKTGSMARR